MIKSKKELKTISVPYMLACPLCNKGKLTFDIRAFTISCKHCHNDWIYAKRIPRDKMGFLGLLRKGEWWQGKKRIEEKELERRI